MQRFGLNHSAGPPVGRLSCSKLYIIYNIDFKCDFARRASQWSPCTDAPLGRRPLGSVLFWHLTAAIAPVLLLQSFLFEGFPAGDGHLM